MLNLFTRPTQRLPVQLRWMVTADMPTVLEIAASGFEYPWLENDFRQALQIDRVLGMTAEHDEHVVGYAVYENRTMGITLLNVAVAGQAQRKGVGTALLGKLASKLERGCELSAIVNERELGAQLWLKSLGFEAKYVLRGHFDERPDDPSEDGYYFRYEVNDCRPLLNGRLARELRE